MALIMEVVLDLILVQLGQRLIYTMGVAYGIGERRGAYRDFVGKTKVKRQLDRPRCK